MLSRLAAIVALIVFSSNAAALVTCGVCAPSIFFKGLTRTLTSTMEEGSNTVQCNYNTPPISGMSPDCLYRNVDGAVIFTNTGATLTSLPGACPAIQLVQKTSC
ncbi:hypothetical protein C8R46DRAFT_1097058 [Mycena filopes]|nr:hypothetical protein C8R46DRAFT_1097058 [Mycena filopes]